MDCVDPEILWLDDPLCGDPRRTGGKAAALARLAADFNVPPGFALSVAAFERWSADALEAEEDAHRAAPRDFVDRVAAAYGELGARLGEPEPSVAVRSSAVDEDSAGASFAGQHSTYLNIIGADSLARAIVRCWASLYSDTVLGYRRQRGLDASSLRMGVLVQSLVSANASGVAFSAHPVTGDRGSAVINSAFGLGESVASGAATPDTFVVDRRSGAVTSRDIAEKERMAVAFADGTREVEISPGLASSPSLTDGQLSEVVGLVDRLETAQGFPVDVEFAIHAGALYLLQCRPITALPPVPTG